MAVSLVGWVNYYLNLKMAKNMYSDRFNLSYVEFQRWVGNALLYLLPIFVIYWTPIVALISEPNHVFTFNDLRITPFIMGAIVTYVGNTILDLARKYLSNKQGKLF